MRGHSGVAAPGETVHAEVLAVAYAGVSALKRIEVNGKVVPKIQ